MHVSISPLLSTVVCNINFVPRQQSRRYIKQQQNRQIYVQTRSLLIDSSHLLCISSAMQIFLLLIFLLFSWNTVSETGCYVRLKEFFFFDFNYTRLTVWLFPLFLDDNKPYTCSCSAIISNYFQSPILEIYWSTFIPVCGRSYR